MFPSRLGSLVDGLGAEAFVESSEDSHGDTEEEPKPAQGLACRASEQSGQESAKQIRSCKTKRRSTTGSRTSQRRLATR